MNSSAVYSSMSGATGCGVDEGGCGLPSDILLDTTTLLQLLQSVQESVQQPSEKQLFPSVEQEGSQVSTALLT